ncbi:CotO family spore coat protein [Thalassobacillus sp. CUG 92003]|uniref:CotO family spore coat protein n=1 Tax=Thalassobacillus sp. CUG 92003 TaxID=2736641 RepID=UPI0015E72B96|nr:CotO family spore coat protein [Thalassobacillus sp. CUG 92003]
MVKQRKLAKKPMLYIDQPTFDQAEVPMQTSYHSTRNSEPAPQVSNHSGKRDMNLIERELRQRLRGNEKHDNSEKVVNEDLNSENHDSVSEASDGNSEKGSKHRERRQRFRDMSNEEKVEYFVQLPARVPKMKCEVQTEDTSIRGYINRYEDGVVHMKTFKKPFQQEIPFDSIEDIRLLGF